MEDKLHEGIKINRKLKKVVKLLEERINTLGADTVLTKAKSRQLREENGMIFKAIEEKKRISKLE